jgi:hypothetical protein
MMRRCDRYFLSWKTTQFSGAFADARNAQSADPNRCLRLRFADPRTKAWTGQGLKKSEASSQSGYSVDGLAEWDRPSWPARCGRDRENRGWEESWIRKVGRFGRSSDPEDSWIGGGCFGQVIILERTPPAACGGRQEENVGAAERTLRGSGFHDCREPD